MRFNRLDILRYGALTGTALEFRPGARLHVVYGPNEAGKSSTLSAFSDLLFGFPRSTAHFSFLHDAASLRVGAEISSRAGEVLSFRRRRGAKNTLLANDDKETALAEDALVPFLGNLNREIFERAFGLDSERLREGATAMLHSGGELGSLLFSAASGLLGLTRLRQDLESEAEGIFAPRKSQDRLFYQAVDRHEKAKRAERENELKSGDWKRLVTEGAELDRQVKALHEERQHTRHALDRLQKLKILHPLVAEIDREAAALSAYADLESLPHGFAAALEQVLDARRNAETHVRSAESARARVGDAFALVHIDAPLLAAARDILALYADIGSYRQARRDLPRVDSELAGYDATLAQLARRLGVADAGTLIDRQPADADLVALRALAEEGQALVREKQTAEAQRAEERRSLDRLEAANASGMLIDPQPYAEQLEAMAVDLSALQRRDGIEVQLRRGESSLGEALSRLRPAVADLDLLLRSPLPDSAAISLHRQAIDAADAKCRKSAEQMDQLARQLRDVERALAEAEQSGTLVTRAEITAARDSRDAHWQLLFERRPDGKGSTIAADPSVLQALVLRADQLADTALADADRVARHASDLLRQSRLLQEQADAREGNEADRAALAAARAEFAKIFEACGIVAAEPADMLEWRRAVDNLAAERQALYALRDQLAAIDLAEGRVLPALRQLADAVRFESGALPAVALAEGLRKHLGILATRWNESRTREGERASTLARLRACEDRLAAIEAATEKWQQRFSGAAETVGLRREATVDMAFAALKVWDELPDTLLERENRARRVNGMRRDIEAFEEKAAALAATIAPALASQPADAIAEALHDLAMKAQSDAEKQKALREEMERVEASLLRSRADLAAAEAALAAMEAQLPVRAELAEVLERLGERARLLERLGESRSRFAAQADGLTEEGARTALEGFDRVAADLEIERLSAEDQRQVEAFAELTARSAENRRQREALETGTSAELAVFERLSAESEARDLARQWVVLKLAADLLADSMESYRERQADPVLKRAGEHFSLLTGGRFARLAQEYGEGDQLQLLVERQGGERVPLTGLSEGTGDQLYLALRLAFLEDYSTRNEPAPLILDDIFQTFDDERTACGIRTLGELGAGFQTILFTHEMSVVDIARRELGEGLDLVRF